MYHCGFLLFAWLVGVQHARLRARRTKRADHRMTTVRPPFDLDCEPDDVRAYGQAVQAVGDAGVVHFEEEDFERGMRLNALDCVAADVNSDGRLDFDEFCGLVRAREVGFHSETALRQRFAALDADGSGLVEMNEYLAFSLRDALVRSSQRVMDLFRQWDTDGSGEISKKEFRKAVRIMGFDATRDMVDALFAQFDADTSGRISYRELNRALRHGAGSILDATAQPVSGPTGGVAKRDRQGWSQHRHGLHRAPTTSSAPLLPGLASIQQNGEGSDFSVQQQICDALSASSTRVIDLFRLWDSDGNGRIDSAEFRVAMGALGLSDESMRKHVDSVFHELDADGTGYLEYRELNDMLLELLRKRSAAPLDATRQVGIETKPNKSKGGFRRTNAKDGRQRRGMASDVLATVDLAAASIGSGVPVPILLRRELAKRRLRVRELFVSWDTNGDGCISRQEFIAAIKALGLAASNAASF